MSGSGVRVFAGVYFDNARGKWGASLWVDGKRLNLGRFGFEGDAAICWNYHVAYLGLKRPLNVIIQADWHHDME
jgi:hypothetical protein